MSRLEPEEAESALTAAKGLVDASIASNPTNKRSEVSKWWKQHKKSFDCKLRNVIPLLDELSATNPTFDVSNVHTMFKIIRESREYYSLFKNGEESPFC